MNKFIALTKVLLKTNGESFGKSTGKFKLKGLAFILLLTVCFLPLAFSVGTFVNMLYETLSQIGQQGVILGLGFSMSSIIIFFLGIFYVMGTFYFSMDVDYLLPLPFKPSQILGAKLIVVLIYEYLTQFIVLAPIIATYGFKDGAGILYYIFGILIFLTIPIIPLVISSILVMVIMRFANTAKNKDRFKMIGGIIAIFIGVGINILMQRTASNLTNPEKIQKMFAEGNNSLISLVTKLFPSSKLAALALAENTTSRGFINLGLFIALTLLCLFLFIAIGEALYFKGVIGISETTSRRTKLSTIEFSKATEQNSLLKAYTLKELKILFRTPAYFMNCIIINFFWPIFLLLPLITNSGGIGNLEMVRNFINAPNNLPIIMAGSSLLFAFVSSSNGISSTSISREGRNLFINKFLPISYKTQIISKALSGMIMSLVGMFMLILSLLLIAKPSLSLIILIIITGLLVIPFANLIGILIDLNSPRLNWDNEQKAVKQNMNLLISWILTTIIPGLLGFIIYKLNFTLTITIVFLLVLYGVIDLILYRILAAKGVEMYSNL
ncbi:hypothetical protein GOM49_05455 [Clostridium bovifaecis]|uniref:Uncharacterized protein n=1 Tax=Clostridium bovifaecis TaxID=2184719 RepID=A0A6I6ELT1_9CLOT|nr:hypothetical protein GOM49_05455 [Clostridium bovifaecis]